MASLQQTIQDALDKRGVVCLPSVEVELVSPLVFYDHTIIYAAGGERGPGNNHPGTRFIPASGYTGVGCQFHSSDGYLHGLVMQDMSFTDFASHGIDLNMGLGEGAYLNRLSASNNGGDGLHVSGTGGSYGTPAHFGHLHLHGNVGAGFRLAQQTRTCTVIEYLSMDNNGECGMSFDNGYVGGTVKLEAWKSERWLGQPPYGQDVIFKFNNTNGMLVDIGPGRVSVNTGNPPGQAVVQVNQDTRLRFDGYAFFSGDGDPAGYQYGFEAPNEAPAVTRTMAQLLNTPFNWRAAEVDVT